MQTLTPEQARAARVRGGVIVTRVDPNGAASRRGMRTDMIITHVERQAINNATQFRRQVLQALRQHGSVSMRVQVDGRSALLLIEPLAQSNQQQEDAEEAAAVDD